MEQIEMKEDLLFNNQKRVYRLLNKQNSIPRKDGFFLICSLYDYISGVHGSGKHFVGTDSYLPFMEDKWCIVYSIFNDKVNEEYQKGFSMQKPRKRVTIVDCIDDIANMSIGW